MKRTLAIAALFLSTVFAAQAQQSAPTGQLALRLMEARLNLTSTQRTQIQQILAAQAPAILALQTQLAAEHKELIALTTFNEGETVAIVNKYAETNTAAIVEREKVRDEIYSVLTPAQQQQLELMRAKASSAFTQFFGSLGEAQ